MLWLPEQTAPVRTSPSPVVCRGYREGIERKMINQVCSMENKFWIWTYTREREREMRVSRGYREEDDKPSVLHGKQILDLDLYPRERERERDEVGGTRLKSLFVCVRIR
ncbi:hypothetical protein HanXRQr2_Chr13g0572621 [Helianthus annuus]|uniref:Uncharacterized protein n=1 Tax=Helianthus annuus TaxID=4232 RepID=A0A9K3EFS9_HELAN|nr:hypothetical protein HanXRQr2_Chr13g0572621 [Helianthus annuus]